ncbi:hypothetical protein RB2501_03575 [Robiginitalea biformata HTCC2501]|uniref:Uncharacterized protein n=1 Tax=Robiginitalea biformata (strain ATCC BAA-864 / DSM 15991 / KCTC 12146 / HTCC2501) TaxID=313596 RepID=A4CG85_ROBBH|nr:hypothetical protein RB2501_03575 [Robiginitalea biformata HTCC2501]
MEATQKGGIKNGKCELVSQNLPPGALAQENSEGFRRDLFKFQGAFRSA